MNDTLTITLPPDIQAMLVTMTQAEGLSPESVAQSAIRDYLFIHQFRSLRSQLLQKAQTEYTDDDIFELVS
ncbi:hypothetical protein GFS31_17870 [Leptolyngbya sp. BL0902]|uniref:hypothetical protein n=1 Tax=Leptolyngbya sp. BL0902 TaxID=1115757 RepID=UPI0018E8C113|nr:hypothetical protein [Leptolyngbya sp. BL0902]QQE65102.1 hypothetical protein GFS31_17870 [Leptolyngbya sp. BL0902]